MSLDSFPRFVCVVISILAIACGFPAQAVDVSGPIVVDTLWGVADSPIDVVGSVQIRNGARLTIESGVEVRFRSQSALIVEQGAIRAIGSTSSPIVFGSGEPGPAKGDWGPIEFQNGSNDATSVLDQVVIRHGKGISITQASPTLNRLLLENNLGAAITLDLASSPAGEGLSAQGNDLNGILVPAGMIAGSVRWALVGIPYVVQQGIVAVGLPPITLNPTMLTLREGQQAPFTVRLAKPAPAGGLLVDVVSSVPGVASAPVSVTVPASMLEVTFNITAVAAGSSNLSVSRVGLGAVTAAVTVIPPIAMNFDPPSSIIPVGQTRNLVLELGEPAPAGGVSIALSSSNTSAVTVPAQTSVLAGASSQNVVITGVAAGTSTVTASATGYSGVTASIEARAAFLSFGSLGVMPPGTSRIFTISLSEPAPSGGLNIALSSSDPTVASLPSGVVAAAGQSSVSVVVHGHAIGVSTLTATASNYQSASEELTVETTTLSFDPVGPVTIPERTSDRFIVRLSQPARAGGLTVGLQTPANGGLIVTPANIQIAEGQTAASSSVAVFANERLNGTVTAVAAGVNSALLTVVAENLPQIRFTPASVVLGKGLRSEITLSRQRHTGVPFNDRDPLTLTLTSADPAKVSVPPQVTIPGGTASIRVPFSAYDVSAPIVVTATAPEYSTPASIQVTIVEPSIAFEDLDGNRGVGAIRDAFRLRLTVPGGTTTQVAMMDIPVVLAVAQSNPAGVVSGLFDAQSGGAALTRLIVHSGRDYSTERNGNTAYAFVGSPGIAGSYQISGQIAGQAAQLSALQQVSDETPSLEFSITNEVVAQGMLNSDIYIVRQRAGVPFSAVSPVVVTLTLSEAGKIGVPQTLEIPAGETFVEIPVVGLELTTSPVVINASAPGYAPSSTGLAFTVEQAYIDFVCSYSPVRPSGGRYPLCLSWSAGTSAIDRPVSVQAVEQDPPGIVTGLFAGPTGAALAEPLQLLAGDNRLPPGDVCYDSWKEGPYCPAAFIGHLSGTTGSYRLEVSVPGMGTWLSDLITVDESTPTSLSIEPPQQVVGRGLPTTTVELSRDGPNLAEVTIDLESSDPLKVVVPSSLTFPDGEPSVPLPLNGIELTQSEEPVIVTASVPGQPAISATVTVAVVEPRVVFPGLAECRSVGGMRDDFSVELEVPGEIGDEYLAVGPSRVIATDLTLDLTVVDATPAGIVAGIYAAPTGADEITSVLIEAGQTSSSTVGYVGSPTETGSYRIRASGMGIEAANSEGQEVVLPEIGFDIGTAIVGEGLRSSVVISRRSTRNSDFNCENLEAPESDLTIALSCVAASICSVPATVTLPAGIASVEVPITGHGIGATRLNFSVPPDHLIGNPSEVDVRVVKPSLTFATLPDHLVVGQATPVQVQIEGGQKAAAAVSVTLTSDFPGVATITPSVSIDADANVSGDASVQPLASGYVTFTASAPGFDPVTSAPVPVNE